MFCTVDSQFPMSELDQSIPDAEITFNLLWSSHLHPSFSAYASLFVNYDFNRMPLAPPGTRVVSHTAAETHASFACHGRGAGTLDRHSNIVAATAYTLQTRWLSVMC